MKRFAISLVTVAAMMFGAGVVRAQTPYVTYYAPSTVYYSAPASSYVAASPTVTYYSAPSSYYSYYPSTSYYPAATYYAPSYSYYSAPVVTRYRPILGGTVSRYVTSYAPVYYAY